MMCRQLTHLSPRDQALLNPQEDAVLDEICPMIDKTNEHFEMQLERLALKAKARHLIAIGLSVDEIVDAAREAAQEQQDFQQQRRN